MTQLLETASPPRRSWFGRVDDFLRRPNSAALGFLMAGSFWMMVGTIYGGFSAIHLLAPEFFNNIPALAFGRERPVHVNTILFGFVTTTLLGVGQYAVPAVLRTRIWSERLAWLGWLLWNSVIASGPICFAFGFTQGREYTEYPFIFDIILESSLAIMLFNVIMTIATRSERTLYITVWYHTGAIMWTMGAYFIGNVMWSGWVGAADGLIDSIYLWYWGHVLPGLLLTPLATGAAYYVIPRLAGTPLFSHTLSLIGFWTLVWFYTHIGGHHIVQSPIPNWLKVMSNVDSMAMVVPVFTVLVNLWLTGRQRWGRVWADPAGRLVLFGLIWYLVTCIQGPLQSLPSLQRVTHFNNWEVGHAHIAVLGFAGFIALGGLWHVLPYVTGLRIYSARLVSLQFGLLMVGITGFFVVLTTAGLLQGHAWYNGEVVWRELPEMPPYMALRLLAGLFIITSSLLGFYNLMMTLRRGQRFEPVRLHSFIP